MTDRSNPSAPFRPARPAVAVAGRDQPALGSHLINLMVVESVAGLARCEATFGNWGPIDGTVGFLFFKRDVLDFGKPLKFKSVGQTLFDGRITGLEAAFPEGQPPRITVLAEDRLQDLRMTRRTRTFNDITDADVFRRIAREHGLKADVKVNGEPHKVLAQVNQSDLAFLRDRAIAADVEFRADGDTLRAKSRPVSGGSPTDLTYGSDLREFTVLADLATQRTSLTVTGWDVAGKANVAEVAGASAVSNELSGDGGAALLRSAFGERKEIVAHTVPFTKPQALDRAKALFRQTARRFVTGRGVCEPSAALRAGGTVNLKGLGPLFSGKYYLSEVKHLFDGTDFWTEFTAERAGLGKPS